MCEARCPSVHGAEELQPPSPTHNLLNFALDTADSKLPMASLPQKPSRAAKLESAASLAMLQDQLVEPRRSTLVGTSDGTAGNAAVTGLQVSIKRGLLALVAVLTISVLIAITLLFSRQGVVLHRFDKGDLTTKQQQDLLERYNSYSGTIAAAVERPLGLFVALMVDIMIVRFMTDHLLEVEPSLSLRVSALALSAGFGYLLANGLSALNIQAHVLPVQPVISAQDLSRPLNETGTSTMAASYPDYRRHNPLQNTILRNLLLPRALSSKPLCESRATMDTVDSVEFGFPQLPWMQSLLSESLDAKTMTIAVGTTSGIAANKRLTADQFPMNASVAAELLIYGAAANSASSPSALVLWSEFLPTTKNGLARNNSVARLAGMISPNATASETVDREWFLAHSPNFTATFAFVTRIGWNDTSLVGKWTLNLTHVPITPSIWVDAVTIEHEIDSPQLDSVIAQDGTRYSESVFLTSDGKHVPVPNVNDSTDAVIYAYGICEGTLTGTLNQAQDTIIECKNKSASSIFLVSRAKRLMADAIIGYADVNSSGVFNGSRTVVANLRQVTLWTYARISWKLQNLAEKFGAKCMDDSDDGCLGLDVELPSARQRLLVGKAALPIAQVPLFTFNKYFPQQVATLVSVTRPREYQGYRTSSVEGWLGDFLLPHNVRDLSRSAPNRDPLQNPTNCMYPNEQRLANYVNNHLYMDSTLQATYTAAVFFLFQNGIALDVVSQPDNGTTLAFSQNVRPVVLRALIPRLNVWLTLAGCGAMVCALVVVLFWQLLVSNKSDPLQRVTMPHSIARVMVDSASFPSVLLQRSVLEVPAGEEQEEKVSDGDADAWMIRSIALQRKIESEIPRPTSDLDDGDVRTQSCRCMNPRCPHRGVLKTQPQHTLADH